MNGEAMSLSHFSRVNALATALQAQLVAQKRHHGKENGAMEGPSLGRENQQRGDRMQLPGQFLTRAHSVCSSIL